MSIRKYPPPHPRRPGKPERHEERECRDDCSEPREGHYEPEPGYCDEERPCRIVERIWYFEDEDECRPDPCHPGSGGQGGDGGGNGSGRPTRPGGEQTGTIVPGAVLTPGDISDPLPPGVWGGPRTSMDLPYLFMRANAGDLGARPVVGPFWESPDIFLLAGTDPSAAPAVPPSLGQVAEAGKPNTIYAHVWNFGNAAANEVLVEFYWVNPALGITEQTVNLIAQTLVSLGAKGSGQSHALVKCPKAWVPTFVNGGHECLLVRIWDNPADLPGEPLFDARWNRHVAQRNIHVDAPAQNNVKAKALKLTKNAKAAKVLAAPALAARALKRPILINVGALYGAPAEVKVERVAPNEVPWLQQHTGERGKFPVMAPPTGQPALSPPAPAGGGFGTGATGQIQTVHHDNQMVAFTTTDDPPGPGEAHVYRVTASQNGEMFGGYTIIVTG